MDKTDIKKTLKSEKTTFEHSNTAYSMDIYDKTANELLEIGNRYLEIDSTQNAVKYYENALKRYKLNKDIIGEGYALTGLGIIHERLKEYADAIKYYKFSSKKFQKAKDNKRSEKVLRLLADLFLKIGDEKTESEEFKEAEYNYNEAIKYYQNSKDNIGIGYAFTGLGIVYGKYEKFEESRKYFKRALKKFQKTGDYEKAGIVSNLIANTFELQDAPNNAVKSYRKSIKLFKRANNQNITDEINQKIEKLKINKTEQFQTITNENLNDAVSRDTRYFDLKYQFSIKSIPLLILYLGLIILSEILTTYYNIQSGLLIDSAVIFALLIHASIVYGDDKYSNLLMSMMVIPMIRIIGLSVPLMQVQTLYWFPIISIPLFASAFVLIKIQKINRKSLGLTWGNIPIRLINIPVQLLIASTGILLGFIEYEILNVKPLISAFDPLMIVFAGIILLISTGFAEELLFRGILQQNAQKILGVSFGLLYTSLLFTSLHIGWKSPIDLVFVFGVSMFYGYMFQKTRSLFGITLSHGLSNAVLFLIMPFLVF